MGIVMIKLFSMFSGDGGSEFGLLKANIPYECVGYSEIDKFAIKCYNINFPNIKNFGDCTKINPNEIPDFDLLTGGFPCHDCSIAGNRDLSKGRTNLYNEILRIASAKKPRYMLLENVKGLLSMEVDDDNLINKIVRDLKSIGYGICWKVLNSKDYGIPQNRERVWFVCKLGGWDFMEFQFPEKKILKIFIKDILEEIVDKKYYLKENQIKKLLEGINEKNSFKERIIQKDISRTLLSRDYKDPKIVRLTSGDSQQDRIYNIDGIMCSLPSSSVENKVSIFALRGRNPDNPSDRTKGIYTEQNIEFNNNGTSNCLTTCQKDNLLMVNLQTRSKDRPSLVNKTSQGGSGIIYKDDGTSYCIDTGNTQAVMQLDNNQKFLDLYNHKVKEICPTLKDPCHNDLRVYDYGIFRRLTPKECFRLMGFLDDNIILEGLSDSAKYKLAGNGWEISVVSSILKQMFKGDYNEKS